MFRDDWTHRWYWKPVMGGKNRRGMLCRVLITSRNKVLVEMADGERTVTMRYAVREVHDASSKQESLFEK